MARVCVVTTLLLVRHGETDWNRDRLWQGHTGPALNDVGRRQAAELAGRISHVDAVYSSDSERAHETALILAARLGLRVTTDTRLREIDFGEWEGLTRAQIDERFGTSFANWLSGASPTPTGGESDKAMAARVFTAVSEIAQRHPAGRVLIVTHGGPIRAVQARLRGIDLATARTAVAKVPNCSLVELVVREGAWAPA